MTGNFRAFRTCKYPYHLLDSKYTDLLDRYLKLFLINYIEDAEWELLLKKLIFIYLYIENDQVF
jgi:hypothetical protein